MLPQTVVIIQCYDTVIYIHAFDSKKGFGRQMHILWLANLSQWFV